MSNTKPDPTNKNPIDYKEIFEYLKDGIIITNKNFEVIDINHSLEHLLNSSRKKILGKKYSEVFTKEINNIAQKAFREQRTVSEDEIKFGFFLNEPIYLQVTVTPYFDKEGGILGLITQLKDIEGSKFLSGLNSQQQFNTTFENLILGLAHELKNPLSGIKGAAQLLNVNPSEEEILSCSHIIVKETDRLIELLNGIKKLDEFSTENFNEVDIHEVLLEIIFLERKSNESVVFKESFDVTIPPVKGNENSLKQVFLNIIHNSIESISNKKGEIKVKTRWVNDYKLKSKPSILISINDNGAGIPKDSIHKIFTPFFSTKSSGSGLGLFISNQIVAKHGGAIFVESTPDEGSEFKVYLPS